MEKENNIDVENFLLHSEYFRRYILPDWIRRNPEKALALILQIRGDEKSEAEIQYHLDRVRRG